VTPDPFGVATKAEHQRPELIPGRCPLHVPHVSTDLRILWLPGDQAQYHARDLQQRDGWMQRTYRRLDLDYYRWQIAQLDRAEAMVATGQITDDRIRRARATMSLLQAWIEAVYPPSAVASLCLTDATTYAAPPRPRTAA
jgi:hypothetical protein